MIAELNSTMWTDDDLLGLLSPSTLEGSAWKEGSRRRRRLGAGSEKRSSFGRSDEAKAVSFPTHSTSASTPWGRSSSSASPRSSRTTRIDLAAQLDALEKQDERWLAELSQDVEDLELTGALADVANFLHDADACMRLIRKPTYTDAEAAQIATLCHTAAAAARTVKPDSNSAWLDNLDHVIPTIALWWHRVFGVGLGVFAAQAAEHFNKIAKHYLRYQSYGNASPINKLKHMMREVNWRAIHHRDFGRKKRRHSSL